jgi:hypothetical protein
MCGVDSSAMIGDTSMSGSSYQSFTVERAVLEVPTNTRIFYAIRVSVIVFLDGAAYRLPSIIDR